MTVTMPYMPKVGDFVTVTSQVVFGDVTSGPYEVTEVEDPIQPSTYGWVTLRVDDDNVLRVSNRLVTASVAPEPPAPAASTGLRPGTRRWQFRY